MSKTPYEIRLELLQLVATTLSNRIVIGIGIQPANYEPSMEEIMSEANKLNLFVSEGLCECPDCTCNPCTCTSCK